MVPRGNNQVTDGSVCTNEGQSNLGVVVVVNGIRRTNGECKAGDQITWEGKQEDSFLFRGAYGQFPLLPVSDSSMQETQGVAWTGVLGGPSKDSGQDSYLLLFGLHVIG